MKKITFLICFALVTVFTKAQWTQQNPYPTSNCLLSVHFPDANTGYAVGRGGIIIKTINAGSNWDILSSGTTIDLNSVFFIDAITGYAAGGEYDYNGTIIKTIDGGTTWTVVLSGINLTLNSVFFTAPNTGYALGRGGTILKTIDGGTNWDSISSGINGWLNSVFFIDANTGYAVGSNGTIIKTTNGGTNWNTLSSGISQDLVSVFFTDSNLGWIINEFQILKTIDGGSTWSVVSLGINYSLHSVYFTDANTGYAVGGLYYDNGPDQSYGTILKTIDGGLTWTVLSSGLTQAYYSIYFTDANTGYVVGYPGIILKTNDGGTTWSTLSGGITNSDLFSVYFTDANKGYAVGSGGTIIKTTNGGTKWNALSSVTNSDLGSVYFTDANIGYAIGEGITLKTINGGTTWNILSEMGGSSVYFYNANTWYAWYSMGNSIIKTIDGGTTWTELSIGTTNVICSFYFTDINTGFAVGSASISDTTKGVILKTLDGGSSWTCVYNTNLEFVTLNSIYFLDADTGYAYGINLFGAPEKVTQISLKTEDGGTIWNDFHSESIPYWDALTSVYFADSNVWYGTGNFGGGGGFVGDGRILKTIDRGITWNTSWSNHASAIYSMYFPDANTGYAVGDDGLILKTTNGGGVVSIKETQTLEPPPTFTIFPNPATHKISITTTGKLQGETTISIYGINGAKTGTYKFQNTHSFELDVSQLAKGVYLLKIQTDEGVETQKLVVQ